MKSRKMIWCGVCAVLAIFGEPRTLTAQQETIIAIRHGEKPAAGLGQLTCKGLNRALALPKVLIGRYGKPDLIYAPSPAEKVTDAKNIKYSYVRPLATIEPTAIQLGLPVNAQIGFTDVSALQKKLIAKENEHAVIFVAWEHLMLNKFAQKMLKKFDKDPSLVPAWPNTEYDRIYVFRISQNGEKRELTFTIEQENLDGSLGDHCPGE